MRSRTMIIAAGLTAAVVLAGTGTASAADPVYTCQSVVADDINRIGGVGCTGGPAGYQGAGEIKLADSDVVWKCALLSSAVDAEHPGTLIVVGFVGCEQPGDSVVS
ncbi:hypothetical protein OG413_38165 [Streptomyces sp. NBC_01433]|uniref:hypothetical protein n=1 Tax=Streptomyces sp. NBC_01433 TaxID=2903864 RepID=UPI002259D0F5|nr:hypothetical protein [Streptomyces sp. NBC_01433]MCX4681039.1 hypothetical protein [Streptomyces sp. NBC_01433]